MRPCQEPEALLDEIGELYAIVLRIARSISTDDAPMTATQRLALIEVAAVGPLRLNSLASRMDTTPATATRAIDFLEDAGFVRREAAPGDRRGIHVVATAKGHRWSDRRRAHLLEVIQMLPPGATTQRMVDDLHKLNAALRVASGHSDVARGALLAP
jgi:DNA-binding MarR family transcriptional regulator